MIVVVIMLAGGLGSVVRFVVDGAVRAVAARPFPYGTMIINVSGSFLLGLITALTTSLLPVEVRAVAGTGFLGGYTTFSTASFETVRLVQERRWTAAIVNGLGTLLLTVTAAALGYLVGSAT